MSKSASKILQTAEQLFNQHSFVGVGVDLIRDESGCSKTTMYTYFQNKNQLVNQVLLTRDHRFRQELLTYVGNAQSLEALNRIIDWHLLWFKTDTFKGCLFVRAVAESNAEQQQLLEIAQAHKVWLRQFIQQSTTAETINHAELLYTLLEGLISRFLVEGYDEQVAQQIKTIFNQMVKSTSSI